MTVQMHIHLMARFHWVHFTNLRKQLVDCSPLVLGRRPSNREVTQCIIRKILIIWMLWECRVLCFIDEKIVLIPAWMIRAEFTTTSRRCCFRSFVDEPSINQWVYKARFFGYAKKNWSIGFRTRERLVNRRGRSHMLTCSFLVSATLSRSTIDSLIAHLYSFGNLVHL